VKASAAETESMRACPLARGLGTAQVPKTEKRLNRCQSSGVILLEWSIIVRHHYRDGGLWVVNVECATSGDQFHQSGAAVVVADIERNRQTVTTGAAAKDGKTYHRQNIPKPSGFVLAGHVRGHGHISIVNGAREKNRETDSGFLRGLGDFNLKAVGDGMGAGVSVNDIAKGRVVFFGVGGGYFFFGGGVNKAGCAASTSLRARSASSRSRTRRSPSCPTS